MTYTYVITVNSTNPSDSLWGEAYTLGNARGMVRDFFKSLTESKPEFIREKTYSSWTVKVDGIVRGEIEKI